MGQVMRGKLLPKAFWFTFHMKPQKVKILVNSAPAVDHVYGRVAFCCLLSEECYKYWYLMSVA